MPQPVGIDYDQVADEDVRSLGEVAKSTKKKNQALVLCVTNVWASQRISDVQRVDSDDFHGWRKWPQAGS